MVYDFVKKMRSELLNEKMELEYEHTKIKNELEQNQRFLEKIMQEEQETYDIFSPRRKNYKLKENIKSLKQKQDGLKKSDEEIRKKLLLLSQKVNDCEKAIKQKKTRKNMVLEPEFNKTKDLAKKDKEEVYEANKNTAIMVRMDLVLIRRSMNGGSSTIDCGSSLYGWGSLELSIGVKRI